MTGQVEHTLEGHSGSINSVVFSHDRSKPNSCSFYSVDESGYWVTQNGSRVLNLPVDHRPSCTAAKGSNLAIGSYAGRVTIITFYLDAKT